jgi:hypothetical protein
VITRTTLNTYCRRSPAEMPPRQAFDACLALGPYALWWLDAAVREKATAYDNCHPDLTGDPPPCPTDPGACNVLLVRRDEYRDEYPALASAFILSLRWHRNEPHAGVPRGLTELADRVLEQFGGGRWGLRPALADSHGPCGLCDDLGLTFESAWATLAGGLVLAQHGLHSQAGVFASACWDSGYGAKSVEGLEEKLRAVLRHGGRELAVAPGQFEEVRRASSAIEIHSLGLPSGSGVPRPDAILTPYLLRIGAPPVVDPDAVDVDEQFERGVWWYRTLTDRQAAGRYYGANLGTVIRRRLERAFAGRGIPQGGRVLAMVVSDNLEVVPVLAEALAVHRVMLFHTPDRKGSADAVAARVAGATSRKFSLHTVSSDLASGVAELVRAAPDSHLILDVTAGTTQTKLGLERIARTRYPNSHLVYIAHQTPDGRFMPGTEYPLVWRADSELPELPPSRDDS